MFPVVVSAGHFAAGDVGCHSAVGMVDVAGSSYDSIDEVVPGTSVGSLAEGWCADRYYF